MEPFHFIAKFEPKPDNESPSRDALRQVVEPSRLEPGCLCLNVFESTSAPTTFAIHSEWINEAAFDLHAALPHTRHFVTVAEPLLTHPIEGQRLMHIAGGLGQACEQRD